MKQSSNLTIFFLFLTFYFLSYTASTFAQTTPKDTISVSPSLIQLDLQTDKPVEELTYTNATNQTFEISFAAQDFTDLEDGYKVSFFEEKDAKNYKYALSSWLRFEPQSVIIPPHQKGVTNVTVLTEKLTAGGHYASIMAKIAPVSLTQDPIHIQGILSSLIFVRTNQGIEKDEAHIVSFVPAREYVTFPRNFTLRFNNTGDTYLTPYGIVTIKDMFGRVAGKGILNEASAISLPQSIKRYDIPVETTGMLLPGMYRTEFTGHFGKRNQKMHITTIFFSEGSIPVLPLTLMLLGSILGFIVWKKKK